jgi:putative transposase
MSVHCSCLAEKRYEPIAKLRQVDVLISQGQNMVDAIRQIGVSEVTYYRWRREVGGLRIEQMKRLQNLERENIRLRKAVSELTLDRLILQEVRAQLHVFERRAGASLGEHRSTQRKVPRGRSERGASDGRAPKEQE